MSRDKEIKTAFCPACGHKKVSAVKSKDGLCDDCGGRNIVKGKKRAYRGENGFGSTGHR